jgi:hypothetical protein
LDGIVIRHYAASAGSATAANDNRPGGAVFTFSSSAGNPGGAGATNDRTVSWGAARKLRPTDLFNDLAEDDGAFRAPVPLCATRGRARPGT